MAKFVDRIRQFFGLKQPVSEELFEELADLLVEGDFGPAEAFDTVDRLRAAAKKQNISGGEDLRRLLAGLLTEDLLSLSGGAERPEFSPVTDSGGQGSRSVILLLGVNGVGKTTTAAKLAARYRDRGARPILAAADTFRAAAVEQLKLHGERLGIRVVAHRQGGDPAAVVYDALDAAQAGGGDLIVADTAGRMHTKSALVEELKKIDRVIETKSPDARYIKWLVLDATTGRNALVQAETFYEAVKPAGVILSKCDSSAKGGVVFSLAKTLRLPVVYTTSGEQYQDIAPFNAAAWTADFLGLPGA